MSSGTGGEAPRQRVRLASGAGGTFGVDDIAVAWATSGGFWEAEGLDVEWVPVRGGVRAVEAVLAGQVDGGYGTWVPCVKSRLEGKPLTILASMAQALAQNLVARKDRITNPSELKGKRWAIDGLGALSHTLAQLIAKGVGISAGEVEWIVAGPPPQRIEQLLSGEADCSLVRVEEAMVLSRQHPDTLCKLLGFEEIFPLAPTQPHGVISVTDEFVRDRPDACAALVRGLVRASRSLHDSLDDFKRAVRDHVIERPETVGPRVEVADDEIEVIWQRERDAGSFAVNGGLTRAHWSRSLQVYADLYGDARATSLAVEDFAAPQFLAEAIELLGVHAAGHDTPPPGTGDEWPKRAKVQDAA
mmetsp:Transcript_31542/g.86903  ORF Transcript_31542/g.86903 Transcript_31542/m.86903 type:complete len:359 (-) Transcript_31542:59-1135(-)